MPARGAELDPIGALYGDLARLGPGDDRFTRELLDALPPLPARPRIADVGCGTGAATLLLAERFGVPVTAVDRVPAFLAALERRARARGVAHLVRTEQADMAALPWPRASLDLLWSEGAAYNLTLRGALDAWRPLLAPGGVAVLSELCWLTDDPPERARRFWHAAYPALGSELDAVAHAEAAGFLVQGVHRLPEEAWWSGYYGPLERRAAALRADAGPALAALLDSIAEEVELFREHDAAHGYAYFVLTRASRLGRDDGVSCRPRGRRG